MLAACSGASELSQSAPRQNQEQAVSEAPRFEVLVFSRTAGFRHSSIPTGISALIQLGQDHNFGVVATEDSGVFREDSLAHFDVVVFLNTTLDVLNEPQQSAFQEFIRAGKGFVGVHSAADTEYEWEWYGGLVGAYFESHPHNQYATIAVTDPHHPATRRLPSRWVHVDEWYNYKANPREDVHVLATVREESYEGGTMGHDHPIAWAHEYDGGRAFYTGLGHLEETYENPFFLEHLRGGIEWAAGTTQADVAASLATSYEKVVLTDQVTDPMELDITSDGRVFFIEWAGSIKIWEPETGQMRLAGWLPVDKTIEDGLLGLALDPGFDENGWMYIYYSPIEGPFNRLSRFTYDGEKVDMDSEIALLEIPVQRVQCCHSAGSLQFDHEGNLFLSTGDNSGGDRDHEDPYRRRIADQGRTALSTNDLRGKILRIHPEPDGTYTIPEGNLFEADSLHRPEIFTMGHRNPFRISVDQNGSVYWGDVGAGGIGLEEFNRATEPGFFGWPLFSGYNLPYTNYYVSGVEDMTPYRDPEKPKNVSPFNTGARELPPAQRALIPYTYGTSEEFPELEAGGANPMAGPVFQYDADAAGPNALPAYFDGKWLIYEWMRHWLQVVTFDEVGNIVEIDPFLPGISYVRPIDIEVGPDGRLYVLEWGDEFWGSNANAQLVRLDYYGQEGPPEPEIAATAESPKSLSISWPPNGGFFDFEEAIEYKVTLYDQAESDRVRIRTYTGFDTSPILLNELRGLEGTFEVSHAYTHTPDIHYANRFAELEACYLPVGGSKQCDRVRLHPRTKEAEHLSDLEKASRKTYSARSASEHWARTALTVMQVSDGSRLTYDPVNLANIESLTVRFKPHKPNALTIQLGDGQELAQLELNEETGNSIEPEQMDYIRAVPEGASGMQQLDPKGFVGWREITLPVTDPGGTHPLHLSFSSPERGMVLELDWVRFNGAGVTSSE